MQDIAQLARARKLCSIVINMLHTAIISNALLTPWYRFESGCPAKYAENSSVGRALLQR